MSANRMTPAAEDRFWSNVAIPTDVLTGCWLWKTPLNVEGMARFRLGARSEMALRLAFTLVRGALPSSLRLKRQCGNACCVSPYHADAKTRSDLMVEKMTGSTHSRGEKHPGVKLTVEQVHEIRALCLRGETQREIAKRYGVSAPTISAIHNGRNWWHS